MTPIDRAVNSHSRTLLLGFAAVVCVATGVTLFLSSAPELDCTRSATIRQQKQQKQQRLEEQREEASWPSNPNDWSIQQLKIWLLRRHIYPPDGAHKIDLIRLVLTYEADS